MSETDTPKPDERTPEVMSCPVKGKIPGNIDCAKFILECAGTRMPWRSQHNPCKRKVRKVLSLRRVPHDDSLASQI